MGRISSWFASLLENERTLIPDKAAHLTYPYPVVKILELGKPIYMGHSHSWDELSWDEERFGHSDVTDIGDMYATYHYHKQCETCDMEIHTKRSAYI